jgi:hypothetical protein
MREALLEFGLVVRPHPDEDMAGEDLVAGRVGAEGARGRSALISHRLCEDFVGEWRDDLVKWRDFLDWVPVSSGPDKFAWEVGMASRLHLSAKLLAAA